MEALGVGYRGGVGKQLVVLHGGGGTWRQWRPVIPALEAHHDVLGVNLVGHLGGAPHAPGAQANIDTFADGVERTLDEIGWATPHIAGISLGGLVALVLARRGRARTCTAIATVGGWDKGDPGLRMVARTCRRPGHGAGSGALESSPRSEAPALLESLRAHRPHGSG